MAVAKMSHIRVIGLRSQENKIFDALSDNGLFEARATDKLAFPLENGEAKESDVRSKQARVSFALDFIKKCHTQLELAIKNNKKAYNKGKTDVLFSFTVSDKKFSSMPMLITHADFSDVRAKEYDLLNVCDALTKISFDIADCKKDASALKAQVAQYKTYRYFPVRFSKYTRGGALDVSLYFSSSGVDISPEDFSVPAVIEKTNCGKRRYYYSVLSLPEHTAAVDKRMAELSCERCTFTDDCTAYDKIASLGKEKAVAEMREVELFRKALDYEKYYDELRILYDVLELEAERAHIDAELLKTENTFVLEGWLPEAVARKTVDGLREEFPKIFIQLLAPEERDAPPTLLENNILVKPYEDVTNLYNPPKYGELDPNPIMSIFYFLFFGIMVGDAAYGVVLAVIGLALGYSKKFTGGTKRLILLIGWGGVSAVIWGIVFGAYFGIDFGSNDLALWFNPMAEPLTLLFLSVVLGCVQIATGYVVLFVKLALKGDVFSAICDALPTVLLFCGLGCVGVNLTLDPAISALNITGIVLIAVALAIMIIFGGRKSKKIVGKIFGGFKNLYGLISLFSDALSYCRLFGLCLASGAIALAFNTLGAIFFGLPVVGYPLGILLLIPLHALNLALGVFSAYVHDARLQFLEFYGKFYEGGGRLFAPLGSRTKHIRFA